MKRSTIRPVLVLALLVTPMLVAGPDWVENDNVEGGGGDAGSLPPDAQPTTGAGPVVRIRGILSDTPTLAGAVDLEDMYLIFVEEPGTFLATTDPAFGGFADFDSSLFLFDADGNGLLGNGDSGGGSGSTVANVSTDGTSVVINDPGLYYLAITVAPRVPASPAGVIFDLGGSPLDATAPSGAARRNVVRAPSNVVLGAGGSARPAPPPPPGGVCENYEGPDPIPCGVPAGNTITIDPSLGQTLFDYIAFESPDEKYTVNISVTDLDDAEESGLSIVHQEGNVECPYDGVELSWAPGCLIQGNYQLILRAETVFLEGEIVGCVEVPIEIAVFCSGFPDCEAEVPGYDDCENAEKDEAIPCGVPDGNTFTIAGSRGSLFDFIGFELPPYGKLELDISVCDYDDAQGNGLSLTPTFAGGGKTCFMPGVEFNWVPGCAVAGTYQLLLRARSFFYGSPAAVACVDVPIDIVVTECLPEGEVSGPDGPGGDEPISDWIGEPGPVNTGEYEIILVGVNAAEPLGPLDIMPGACPNLFDRDAFSVTTVGLLGRANFDVSQVDLDSLVIYRTDGVGLAVEPTVGPDGPHTYVASVGTPFDGDDCECDVAGNDGILDILIKFQTQDMVDGMLLDELPPGDLVEMAVSGMLTNGTEFESRDCVRLVPEDSPPGTVTVQTTLPDAWVDVSPLDLSLDGGAAGSFDRTWPMGTLVTLTAAPEHQGQPFVGFLVDGYLVRSASSAVSLTVDARASRIDVIYGHGPGAAPDAATPDAVVGNRAEVLTPN